MYAIANVHVLHSGRVRTFLLGDEIPAELLPLIHESNYDEKRPEMDETEAPAQRRADRKAPADSGSAPVLIASNGLEVPVAGIRDLKTWVGDDPERAAAVVETEGAKADQGDKVRGSLIDWAAAIVAAQE